MASKCWIIVGVIALVTLAILGYIFLIRSDLKENVEIVPIFGPIELPKAPYWDAEKESIYFVDVYKSVVHRYEPRTKIHKWTLVGNEPMAFVIPIRNTTNKFVVSYGPDLGILTWDGNSSVSTYKVIGPIDENSNVYRANEGKVSPSGSLFVGTHSPFKSQQEVEKNKAGLYAFYDNRKKSKKLLDNITISNGMGWSKDGKKFYYIDSLAYTVESFSYDVKTDDLGDRRLICNFKILGIPGVPDGMAVDIEDKLWVASFGGHQILRIDPDTGSILRKISLDAFQITSAVFAGPSLRDLYITSGFYHMNQSDPSTAYSHSGYIFEALNFDISGSPGVPFNMTESSLENSKEFII